jgi:hypothetical protein
MTAPISNMQTTWSNGAPNTAVKMNVADVSSAASSLLADLQVNGISKFSVRKDGQFTGPGLRTKLLADTDFWVRSDGSDASAGTSNTAGGAWATVPHAKAVIQALDFNDKKVTLHIGTGAWGGPYQFSNLVGAADGGNFVVAGNGSVNTSIQLQFDLFTNAIVRAMTLTADGGYGFASLWCGEHCEVFIADDVAFSSTAGCNTDMYTYDNGAITVQHASGGYAIKGAGTRVSHVRVEGSGRFNASLEAVAVTISNNPTYSTGFLRLQHHAMVQLGNSFTTSGAITGKKYDITGPNVTLIGAVNNLPGTAGTISGLVYNGTGSVQTQAIDSFQIYHSYELSGPIAAGGVYLADIYGPGGSTPRYGYLRLRIDDATGGSEDATWRFGAITNGVHSDMLSVSNTLAAFNIAAFPNFANDAAAAAGGVAIGQLYRNGSVVMIRVA